MSTRLQLDAAARYGVCILAYRIYASGWANLSVPWVIETILVQELLPVDRGSNLASIATMRFMDVVMCPSDTGRSIGVLRPLHLYTSHISA